MFTITINGFETKEDTINWIKDNLNLLDKSPIKNFEINLNSHNLDVDIKDLKSPDENNNLSQEEI